MQPAYNVAHMSWCIVPSCPLTLSMLHDATARQRVQLAPKEAKATHHSRKCMQQTKNAQSV